MNKNICEICLNKTSKLKISFPFFRHSDFKTHSYNLNLDKCKKCQIILNKEKRSEIENLFKKISYSKTNQTDHKVLDVIRKKKYRRTYYQCEIIYKLMKKRKKISVLDVGCFDGQLFKDLSKFFNNYEFYGYDINKNLKNKFPNRKNFNFVSGNINKISKKFDLIVMSHSIMYIKDLSNKFRSFSRLLKKDGKIYIQIPNIDTNPFYSLMGDQFQFFTKNSIKNILKLFNFRIKIINSHIFSRELIIVAEKSKFINKYKFIEDNAYEKAILKIKKIKNNLSNIPLKSLVVMGTTVNAAFVEEILKKRIKFFVDEKISKKEILFRNKKVINPEKLEKNDYTILPYENNKFLLKKFQKKYKGNFYLL